MPKEETKYNQIIGVTEEGVVVLEKTFAHSDNFKGASGYIISPLTQDEIDNGRDPDTLKEYWQEAVAGGYTEESLEDWAEKVNDEYNGEGRQYFYMDDPSSREDMDEAYNRLTSDQKAELDKVFGVKGKDFVDWDCRHCGRCIPIKDEDYIVVLNPELLEEAKKYEQA